MGNKSYSTFFLNKLADRSGKDYHWKTQTVGMIKGQTADVGELVYSSDNLFEDDVEIIAKGGKYYLPSKQEN